MKWFVVFALMLAAGYCDEFVCWNPGGESFTIPNSRTCDGIADCPVHRWSNTSADESKYLCHYPETEFVCNEEIAIPLEQKCDGNNDCPPSIWDRPGRTRDEDLWMCQPEGTFICRADGIWINDTRVCDGVNDCSVSRSSNTSEDENLFNCPDEMFEDKFICYGGEVAINASQRCDGNNNCPVVAEIHPVIAPDEYAFECATEDEFACDAEMTVAIYKRCDGVFDCPGEDEFRCKNHIGSTLTEFVCRNGNIAIAAYRVCDGVKDCPGLDEYKCST